MSSLELNSLSDDVLDAEPGAGEAFDGFGSVDTAPAVVPAPEPPEPGRLGAPSAAGPAERVACSPSGPPSGGCAAAASVTSEGWLRTHLPELERHARRLCRGSSDADDLVQDTLLKAVCFGHQLRSPAAARSWMHQVLRRGFISRCRAHTARAGAHQRYAQEVATTTEPRQEFLTPATERALAQLAPGFGQAVQLVDQQGLSYREAADLLDVPVGTVMSRLHRGRRLLAQQLDSSLGQ